MSIASRSVTDKDVTARSFDGSYESPNTPLMRESPDSSITCEPIARGARQRHDSAQLKLVAFR
eukprot:4799579-Pleurochrysis_carterae.AAC.3